MSEVKNVQEGFDFSNVDMPANKSYLQPGYYTLGITDAKYVKPDGTKPDGSPKTPYIEVTFSGETGALNEKFFVTPKALDRLQYLHMAWFDKKLEKPFKSSEEVGMYFTKVLTMKPIKKGVCVGGKQGNDGKIYANLPYSNFILPDNMNFTEGAFEIGDANYRQNVKMNVNPSTNTNDVMLPSSSPKGKQDFPQVEDAFSDLPF